MSYPEKPNYDAPPPYSGPPPVVQQVGAPTVLVQQYRDTPVRTRCPSCQAEVVTATKPETGSFTYLIMGILCVSCLFWGPCLIPLCMDSAKDVVHTCPSCQYTMGRYNRID